MISHFQPAFLRALRELSSADRQTVKRALADFERDPKAFVASAKVMPVPFNSQYSIVYGDLQIRFAVEGDIVKFIKAQTIPNYDDL